MRRFKGTEMEDNTVMSTASMTIFGVGRAEVGYAATATIDVP